jgi:hypothetical protein
MTATSATPDWTIYALRAFIPGPEPSLRATARELNIIDEKAAADQRTALLALESGIHGGLYLEIYATVCPKVLEPIFAPITIEVAGS